MNIRCPICQAQRTEEVCSCGEDLRKWQEWDRFADLFLEEAIRSKESGKTHLALLAIAKALFLKPESPRALQAMGEILVSLQEFEAAVFYLEKCITVSPDCDREYAAEARALLKAIQNPPSSPNDASEPTRQYWLSLEDINDVSGGPGNVPSK